ncbi:UDP-N-acetylmuramoyl-tripeptide--D-alanyl-D-alanine ligase [Arthrobacter sp. 35W]|uniref:UDP-N-acetylmuramoyl-tripeptide--D-alanyl-D- alanine ligase n=1 Tax=Arthrobacter sp. 35W TaxID=1132441 RepID=UPI0003F60DED|nr:UDP-N-acetylmuramoyl-tripeptide--D-alanyl-D-alanine ligase [Arthrobacter sp. 35W]
MIEFTAAAIAAITHGRLAADTDPELTVALGLAVTDSREAVPGSMYIAKPGESADGHDFVEAAFARGAVLALAEREVPTDDGGTHPAVVVEDAVLAMGALAAEAVRRIRAHSPLTVLAITGSAGKTTTKDLLAGILAPLGPTVAPRGSFNGEVGVPLTVFAADLDTRYLVIEMGATKMGQIDYLTSLVKPDIGIVLGVGSAHAGEFGGVENIARAKGELVAALAATGTAVLNYDDARVRAMAARTGAHLLYFSSDVPADGAETVLAENAGTNADGHPEFLLRFPATGGSDVPEGFPVVSGLLGLHHVHNLLAAAAAAFVAGAPAVHIAAVLNGLAAASRWRMERTDRADGVTVINDAYNANPESMRAALRTLAELGSNAGRRTWAVLGEMLELGDDSIHEHDALGRVAVRLNISRLVVVGKPARAMHVGAVMEGSWGDESVFVADADEAYDLLSRELAPGDIVLVKSSNGAGLRFLGDRIALPHEAHDTTTGERTNTQ